MSSAVIIINVLISVICCYLAWKLWQIGQQVENAARAVLNAERVTYDVLHPSPDAIAPATIGIRNLRQQYQKLEEQLDRIERLLAIANILAKILWRGKYRGSSQSYKEREPQRNRART
ncbi:MAG: hypothetical protein F6J93_23480 [Oscillatoria sp. SIO1A7]|nr:hypothetical protein [Oscillatoria sp. SIO1A7]